MELLYGLVGGSLPHSFSKQIHEALWADKYELMELSREEAASFFEKREFSGVNVTIPYKELAMAHCDFVDESAKKIGCVNTVVNKNGKLYGYNTDYSGFLSCASKYGIDFKNKDVLILGSGATSKTVYAAVTDSGAKSVTRVSRKGEINYENVYLKVKPQVVINTTPVGMYPNIKEAALDLRGFKGLVSFMDVVYNPLRTQMYLNAKAMGINACCGLYMLIAQAISAAEYFADIKVSNERVQRLFADIEKSRANIVLIGMPGSGKTTIGKIIAKKLNRPLYDTDELIEKKANMSIPEIFERFGQAHFRNIESQVIEELAHINGAVISTGGGAPLKEENRVSLLYNGKIYYIKRPLHLLATEKRPLSKGKLALIKLQLKRSRVYKAFANKVIINNGTPYEAAEKIWSEYI